jgi:hypothetical protein
MNRLQQKKHTRQEPDSDPNAHLVFNVRTGSLLTYRAISARHKERDSRERVCGDRVIGERVIGERALRERNILERVIHDIVIGETVAP